MTTEMYSAMSAPQLKASLDFEEIIMTKCKLKPRALAGYFRRTGSPNGNLVWKQRQGCELRWLEGSSPGRKKSDLPA